MQGILSFRILIKEHCKAANKEGFEDLFVIDGVDIAKEVDYLLKGGSQPPVLLTEGHTEATAGRMYHGRNLFLARENHARLIEQVGYDITDKQCFMNNVLLAKERLTTDINRLEAEVNSKGGCATTLQMQAETTLQPKLRAARRGHPEDSSCPEDIKLHVREYSKRYNRTNGQLYQKQFVMLPRFAKMLRDAGIE